ncbi:MAG TPA: phage baseplate assembly protein V [Vicinamibacterales bacterium]|nr:phage baseplate assembly protein V [Vicinamibacterales bacterium]
MATLQGVYTATVLDNRDREGLARVFVRVPGVADAGIWARIATMMAGQNRGTLFIPDVDDEVLVAFERGDPRLPYIIGALWSGKDKPPVSGADAATTRMIRSRSGVTFRIDDKATSLVIETPAGQRITLQDGPGSVCVEDQNGNSVTLTTSGMTINASAKITMNASTVDVSAGMITITAGMSKFSGVVQCDTLIANSVAAASYTPGAGNIW